MKDDEALIGEVLKSLAERTSPEACPDAVVWTEIASHTLPEARREDLLRHAGECGPCLEKLAWAYRSFAGDISSEGVPEALAGELKRAARRMGGKAFRGEPFWLLLFFIFLAASFFTPRYFIQMLLLAALCGARWVWSSRSERILIALEEKKKESRRLF